MIANQQQTLNIVQQNIAIRTNGKKLHNITRQVEAILLQSGIKMGLCNVFLRHTSASLIIQENADPDVLADLETFFSKLIPEDASQYRHISEGVDDMPSHIRSALTKTSETIPITNGRLALGTWQGIFVWEHRNLGHTREVLVHITGC
ncbi:MAG: secondary thiamine-phosphate synthase enzyme YjbQ [Pseudanabaena sp.]|jgi:secondary thiamine-phosphate synthase enzyme|uniref:secondary thiamine-phosphate synthase enzyme YjbQ n=1 Tax=Pseudanabaena mucicola TaxID=71190 RepID=UPI002575FE67|nr:secondary thiamine-phosphate synthase enzyme YjbQ [Pseudanabaena mucicola]MCA6572151.1 YjbQ family protein [Pseudanabaena sp. M53BS1SP1A06MG]MCA6584429.1 YjbQ family protein [Pseudanabaena sp. M34BS1SP1A06MG]MCA6587510.1 YjbQ family protein [Pseudanabaena sp. M051S1SP1A06QC]MCA6589203.1 YjbQ family protein [Pseudanabaena sp. M109S1SP1A06QC]MCA6592745.1 YjbQ family protein [Pseudanabaena sp. M38BS1SP1A06MG]MCA6596299.1 YjbQ family protein [Pseudanabaena sp. M046S1SP1A06QC]MCA6602356.1 YjbQ